MLFYARPFEDLCEMFRQRGIPTNEPGFYDHPNFLREERANPAFLNAYAAFVRSRPYTPDYLEEAEKTVLAISTELHRHLVRDGRLGACIDCSMSLSRMLEKRGIWTYAVKGALTIQFPPEIRREPFSFCPVDGVEFEPGEYGHKWVVAPPFDVIDITVRQQDYDFSEARLIPQLVLEKTRTPVAAKPSDFCNPEILREQRRMGVHAWEVVHRACPQLRHFSAVFPGNLVLRPPLSMKYFPVAVSASDCPLENITSLKLNGMFAGEIYEKFILPKLATPCHGRPNDASRDRRARGFPCKANTRELFNDLGRRLLQFVFPEPHDPPPCLAKLSIDAPVPAPIGIEF